MSVYVDALVPCLRNASWKYDNSCHLFGDTDEEVIEFGKKIGLKEHWYQRKRHGLSHFDLNDSKRAMAVNAGAIQVSREFVFERIRRVRGVFSCEAGNNGNSR